MDIITVFNRLTNSELADCKLFETILNDHYEKFKYFYYMVLELPIEDIQKITCQIENNELIFKTKLTSIKEAKKYQTTFKECLINFTDEFYNKYFSCSIFLEKRNVFIVIGNKEKYKDPNTIYDDSFNFF
jgi:hypothetical protein